MTTQLECVVTVQFRNLGVQYMCVVQWVTLYNVVFFREMWFVEIMYNVS